MATNTYYDPYAGSQRGTPPSKLTTYGDLIGERLSSIPGYDEQLQASIKKGQAQTAAGVTPIDISGMNLNPIANWDINAYDATPTNASGGLGGGSGSAGSGGGGSGGGFGGIPTAPPPPVAPKPFVSNSKVGSALGGLITGTLGARDKSAFDNPGVGLKGLTGKGRLDKDLDPEKDRRRFGQGLFNIGVTAPGGTGVQV